MSIFPKVQSDDIVQVNDKFRIDATRSFVAKGEAAITLIEIEPEAGSGFVDVTSASQKDWFLDWEYSTDGAKVVSVRITTDGAPITVTKTVTAITEADDKLFSSDDDLIALESDILKYIPEGRNTFKYMHREAQNQILEYLNKISRRSAAGGTRLDKTNIFNVDEVRYWSKYTVYRLLYDDFSTSVGDFFQQRSERFLKEEEFWKMQAGIKLDLDSSGSADVEFDVTWRRLKRV